MIEYFNLEELEWHNNMKAIQMFMDDIRNLLKLNGFLHDNRSYICEPKFTDKHRILYLNDIPRLTFVFYTINWKFNCKVVGTDFEIPIINLN